MSSSNIKVVIKARPLLKKEQENKLTSQWILQDDSIRSTDTSGSGERYCFDHVFGETVSNREIFSTIAKPIVDSALEGFNGTIFTYGQTSSGKTYTMLGDEKNPGLIELTAMEIFQGIDLLLDRKFLLRVGYIEIYNERVYDLLNISRNDLKIHDIGNGDVGVHCVEHIVTSTENIMHHLRAGNRHRKRAETNMNELSSRSHAIFRITIESSEVDKPPDESVKKSIITLVDLAGSERADQTGATGSRLKEGAHINKSLFTLTLVINKLSEAEKFVNFRDSKLTRILQTSLTGNALISIICNINPTALEETASTLSFATRAKVIKIKPKVNEILSDVAMMKRLETKIARLESELEKEKNKNCQKSIEKIVEQLHNVEGQIIHSQNSNHNKQRILRRRTWSACVNSADPANVGNKTEENPPNEFMMPCSKLMTPLITFREKSYERLPVLDEFPNIEEFSFTDSQIPVRTPEIFKTTRSSFNASPFHDDQKQYRQLENELEELKTFTLLEQKLNVEHDYVNSLKVQLAETQKKLEQLEEEKIERLKSELLERNEENQRILDLESQLKNTRKEYEDISSEFMDTLQDAEDTRKENISLKEKIKEMEEKLNAKDNKASNANAQETNGDFKKYPFVDYLPRDDKKDFKENSKFLEKTLLTIEQDLLIYKNDNKVLKNRISELEKEKSSKQNYGNVIKSQQLISEKSNNLYKKVNAKFKDLNVIIEQFAGKVDKIEGRWSECKNHFKKHSSDAERLSKQLSIATEKNNKLQKLNADMEQKLLDLAIENDNLKSQLQQELPEKDAADQKYLSSSNALENGEKLSKRDNLNKIAIKESRSNFSESKERESSKLAVKDLEEKVVKYREDLKELETKYKQVKYENKELQIICDGLKSRLRASEKVNEEISSAAEELERELANSNGKYTELFEEKTSLEKEYNEMNKVQCELRLQLEQRIANSIKVEPDDHDFEVMKKQFEKEKHELSQECSDLRLKISNEVKQNQSLLEKLKELEIRENNLEEKVKTSKTNIEELSKECCAVKQHLEKNSKHNNELQVEIATLHQINAENSAKLNALEKENSELKKLLEESNSLIKQAEKEYEKLKLSIVSLDVNAEKRDTENTQKEKDMEQEITNLLDEIEQKNREISHLKSNNALIIGKLENLDHEISQYQQRLLVEVNNNVALKKDIENVLEKNSTLELERTEFQQKIQELIETAANKEASLLKQIHETNKMHLYKTKQLEDEIDSLKAKSHSARSELTLDKNLKSECGRNQGGTSSQNIQQKDQIIRCLQGDNKKLRTQNKKLSEELEEARKASKKDRKSRRLSLHDEKRETLWQSRQDVGTMTMPTSEQRDFEQLNHKIKELSDSLQIKEIYIEKLISEKKNNPLKTENNKLRLLLSEAELKHNKLKGEIAKLKNEIDKRIKELENNPKPTRDCDFTSVQSDQLFAALEELRKLRSKNDDLKRICHSRNKRIKELEGLCGTEKENEVSNKQPEEEKSCKHAECLKKMDEFKKEIFTLQKKYGESKYVCISRGERILALESELDKLRK